MHTLHFISHTHWDREWHEPFQIFRIRLAQTINTALDILASDPDYKYFMLDGQTVVLEDYIEIDPTRKAELGAHIQNGRVLVGPWYILPDEFLVSGEAIIRNIQRGIRTANDWGKSMMVGYIPDPFGHISQMPQILTGFGIRAAMFRRGLADEPTELWWEGADGTRVFTTYLRDGYDNAAWLVNEPEQFTLGVQRLLDSLAPYAVTEHVLMMHGTDHMQPWEGLPKLMRLAQAKIPNVLLIHSNLPEYAEAVEQALSEIDKSALGVVKGELRNPKRHHLLPGVTSTRMWIKQRNARAQTLLEQWAEPLAAVAMNLPRHFQSGRARRAEPASGLQPELHLAWKYLLQNHPHDSICGCSVDQVHEEMVPRYDWVEQIGGEVVKQSLETIVHEIDTRHPISNAVPLVVFNPTPGPRDDEVTVQVDLPVGADEYQVVDGNGASVHFTESDRHVEEYAQVTATAEDLRWTLGAAQSGKVEDRVLKGFAFRAAGEHLYLDFTVSNQGEVDPVRLQAGLNELAQYIANPEIKTYHLRMHSPVKVTLTFFARNLPGYGFRTLWLMAAGGSQAPLLDKEGKGEFVLENEFLLLEPNPTNGTLTILDKTTGIVYAGANRFVDGGDRGDLYNYCPPEQDVVVNAPVAPPVVEILERNAVRSVLRIQSILRVPSSLTANRKGRSDERVDLFISTRVTLPVDARRIDFQVQVENLSRDHRLRVEFPTPIQTDKSFADQAFDLVAREIELPRSSKAWVELPRPEKPMQKFALIRDTRIGLVLAARGLPEYQARQDAKGVTLALTLLRSVGWLSRPDLPNRRGDAGPEKQTPGAQEIGAHVFEYALIPFAADTFTLDPSAETGEANRLDWHGAHAQALAFNAPLRAVATEPREGQLPPSGSWVQVSNPDFILTAIKMPEKGTGLIVRGYNAGERQITVQLRPFRQFARVAQVTLNEEVVGTLKHDESFTVKPREIVTVRFQD